MGPESPADFHLGSLADPECFLQELQIQDLGKDLLVRHLRLMMRIRQAEQKLAAMRKEGLIGGPVHLGAGQEAIATGVSASLTSTDRVFGAHRSHSHVLSMGSAIHGLFAEVLGKDTGLSRGMGGSMHLWDQPRGFYGSVPIVAGTVPLAVGAALAAKLQRTSDVAVVYLGDGAMEEGVVHESLNLARILDLPVLFVVENNFFASHMHISLRQPMESTARFAMANGIAHKLVDGNDVIAVAAAAQELIAAMRKGSGPGFIEAVTYRWYGHVDWREDLDVGVDRSADNLSRWRARDPIRRLIDAMIDRGIWNREETADLEHEIGSEIQAAWEQAVKDPYPDPEALLSRVYAQ